MEIRGVIIVEIVVTVLLIVVGGVFFFNRKTSSGIRVFSLNYLYKGDITIHKKVIH